MKQMRMIRGFVKLEEIQKSEKNLEVSKKNKKLNGCGWVASSQSDFFSDFFNLTRPLSYCLLHMNVSWHIFMIYFAIFVYRVDPPVPMSTISGLS